MASGRRRVKGNLLGQLGTGATDGPRGEEAESSVGGLLLLRGSRDRLGL